MQRSIWAMVGAAVLVLGAATYAQTHAQAPAAPGTGYGGLSASVAGK